MFRENALWNSGTGYALNFGKGTSLLVTPGELLWLTILSGKRPKGSKFNRFVARAVVNSVGCVNKVGVRVPQEAGFGYQVYGQFDKLYEYGSQCFLKVHKAH